MTNGKLKSKTNKAVKWSVGEAVFSKVVGISVTIVLARILGPKEFGLYALAFVVIDGFGLFKSMGFDSALIQRKNDVYKAANTAFIVIPVMGIIIYLTLFVSTSFFHYFFKSQELINVLRVLGLIFIINCFSRIPLTLLQKDLKYDCKAKTEALGQLIYSGTALTLAIMGFGIWSLVYGYLLKTLIRCVMFWGYVKWRPKLEFDKKTAIEMFHFGKYIFLGMLLLFLSRNVDRMAVGKLIGMATLGIYVMAYNFADLISVFLGNKVSEILFPVYSKIQDNYYDLKKAFLKVLKVILIIVLPFWIGLYFMGGDFFKIVFDEKWHGVAPLIKILAGLGVCNTISKCNRSLLLGIKKPKLGLYTILLQVSIYFALIVPAFKWQGVNGIAFLVMVASFAAMVFSLIWVMKSISISLSELYANTNSILIASCIMTFTIIVTKYVVALTACSILLGFLIILFTAVSVYIFSLIKIEKDFVAELKGMIIKS